jgi:hypothetical protein
LEYSGLIVKRRMKGKVKKNKKEKEKERKGSNV